MINPRPSTSARDAQARRHGPTRRHKQSFRTRVSAPFSHRALHKQYRERDRKGQYRRHPEGVEIRQRRRLLLTQVFELLHSQLLRGDRVSVLLNEERLSAREKAAGGRVEGIKILPKPQDVKLIAPLLEGRGQRHPDSPPLVAQEPQQANGGPAQRERRIEVSGYVRRSKTYREPRD